MILYMHIHYCHIFKELFFTWRKPTFKNNGFSKISGEDWEVAEAHQGAISTRKRFAVRSGFSPQKRWAVFPEEKNSNLPSINFFLGGLVVYISNLYENLFFLVCNLWNQKDIYLFIQFFLVLRWKWEKSSTFYQAFSWDSRRIWGRIPKMIWSVGSTLYPGCNRHHLWLLHV